MFSTYETFMIMLTNFCRQLLMSHSRLYLEMRHLRYIFRIWAAVSNI